MIGSLFIYWFLKVLLVLVLVFCGYGISYGDRKSFNTYAVISALFYSFIQGMRWDRGQDYMGYYREFIGQWTKENPEFLYRIIVNSIRMLGIPYWGGFVLYSLFLISAILLIFKLYPKAAVWGLPLFFIMTQSSSENIARQYLAISFVIFAYYAYLKGKKKWMVIWLFCAPLVHISALIAVFVFVLLFFFKVPIRKPWILLVIYIGLYFLWDVSYFSGVTDHLSSLSLGDESRMQLYLENSERWFTAEGSITNVLTGKSYSEGRSLINRTLLFFSQIIIIYYGFKAQITDKRLQIPYYFAYIAIIFMVIGSDIEMYARFRHWFIYLTPVILGVSINRTSINLYEKYAVWAIIFLQYGFYGLIRQIGSIPYSGIAFIWDR